MVKSMVNCLCSCGALVTKRFFRVRAGFYGTCFCDTVKIYPFKVKAHPLWRILKGMKMRCYNASSTTYHNYGGRGISICLEWRENSACFIQWGIENGWKPSLMIDRIDNDGNYEPSNCQFVSNRDNCMNKRNTVKILYHGALMTTRELESISVGIPSNTIARRIKISGWDVQKAISTPLRPNKGHHF